MSGGPKMIDRPRDVRPGEELDGERLGAYLSSQLPGFDAAVTVKQFPAGHSNLTYLVSCGERELILRRPPFGTKIKSAHDMGREYRVLTSLQGRYPKAPRPLLQCDDESVIGAPFYAMERARGIILRSPILPPGLTLLPDDMRRLSTAVVDGLAELHDVDVTGTPIAEGARPEGYVRRQVEGWTGRYRNAQTDDVADVDRAAAWLAANMPAGSGATLIHGDYKYDNIVLDPADPARIIAVLDWEMATVGDPLMDLGTTLGYWIQSDDTDEHQGLPFGPTLVHGNLTRTEVVARYGERSGRQVPDPLFYYVYGMFKIVVIAQQIYKRFKDGFTQDPRFGAMIWGVQVLGNTAARAIDRGRIDRLG